MTWQCKDKAVVSLSGVPGVKRGLTAVYYDCMGNI